MRTPCGPECEKVIKCFFRSLADRHTGQHGGRRRKAGYSIKDEVRCSFVKAPLVLHSPVVVFSTECNTVRNLLLQLYRRSQLERGAPNAFSVLPKTLRNCIRP